MGPELQLFIGEIHHFVDIRFWRKQDYHQLQQCWARLGSQDSAFSLLAQANLSGTSLHVEYHAQANYVEGNHDQSRGVVTLRVADDWLIDMLSLWNTIKPKDDKYSNHEYVLNSKKAKNRGSTKRGYRLQLGYTTRPSGIEQKYELRRYPRDA